MTKSALISFLKNFLEQKKNMIDQDLAAIEESKNIDTKSSMGDKYETSRELAQAEWNKLMERKGQVQQQIHQLQQIDPNSDHNSIGQGAIVITQNHHLFVGVPLGKFHFNNKEWMGISLHSPIGKALEGKKTGNNFTFNNQTTQILSVK
jgi:transcription elongation GreA/GreB family factor